VKGAFRFVEARALNIFTKIIISASRHITWKSLVGLFALIPKLLAMANISGTDHNTNKKAQLMQRERATAVHV